MKAIVNTAPGRLEWLEMPLPVPAAGQVRIRTAACGICATDLLMVAGWQRTDFPAVPGHEWSGVVDSTGEGVEPSLLGAYCVADNALSIGGEVGFEHPGGYAQYFLTEADKVYPLPQNVSPATAALTEPLAVCLHGISRLKMPDLQRVLILGDGPIGMLILILFRHAGARDIVLVGGRSGRLSLASELGASVAFDHRTIAGDLTEGLARQVGGGFPLVVEASGAENAASASLHLVAHGGRILILGDYGAARANIPWNHLLHNEIELIGSNASAGAWPDAVRLMSEGKLPFERLVSHQITARSFDQGIALLQSQREEVVKVVLRWSD